MTFVLKIEVMPDGGKIRYIQLEGTRDMITLPAIGKGAAVHITCKKYPGDTRTEIAKADAAKLLRQWRADAIDVVVVDHRKAVQEVTMPSGLVLNRSSNLLLLVKAFQQYQRGETVLAEDDAQALKVWIGDRTPFGMEAVESIKKMKALDGLEEV
jgi:hypothetical protein